MKTNNAYSTFPATRRFKVSLLMTAIVAVLAVGNIAPAVAEPPGFQSIYGVGINTKIGSFNTALGVNALYSIPGAIPGSGSPPPAGCGALNGLYDCNTAIGNQALYSNTGSLNTATGYQSLYSNKTGKHNTASGAQALMSNTTGGYNTVNGYQALYKNVDGSLNVAMGNSALASVTWGYGNTAIGTSALYSMPTGRYNIGIGYEAGNNLTAGDNNLDIANQGVAGDSDTIRIGSLGNGDGGAGKYTHTATYIAGIYGHPAPNGVPVYVNSSGKLGYSGSSLRYKTDIKDMGSSSAALMKLRPVTFHYKPKFDDGGKNLQYGLIAEEVDTVLPGLVARNAKGEIDTVRYQFLAPMLLNEVQHQQHTLEAQAETLKQQTAINAQQSSEIAELKTQLAKLTTLVDALSSANKTPAQ